MMMMMMIMVIMMTMIMKNDDDENNVDKAGITRERQEKYFYIYNVYNTRYRLQ